MEPTGRELMSDYSDFEQAALTEMEYAANGARALTGLSDEVEVLTWAETMEDYTRRHRRYAELFRRAADLQVLWNELGSRITSAAIGYNARQIEAVLKENMKLRRQLMAVVEQVRIAESRIAELEAR